MRAARCGETFQITLKVSTQLTALLCTHTLNPPSLCVFSNERLGKDAFPLIYGRGWPPLEWQRLVIAHVLHTYT